MEEKALDEMVADGIDSIESEMAEVIDDNVKDDESFEKLALDLKAFVEGNCEGLIPVTSVTGINDTVFIAGYKDTDSERTFIIMRKNANSDGVISTIPCIGVRHLFCDIRNSETATIDQNIIAICDLEDGSTVAYRLSEDLDVIKAYLIDTRHIVVSAITKLNNEFILGTIVTQSNDDVSEEKIALARYSDEFEFLGYNIITNPALAQHDFGSDVHESITAMFSNNGAIYLSVYAFGEKKGLSSLSCIKDFESINTVDIAVEGAVSSQVISLYFEGEILKVIGMYVNDKDERLGFKLDLTADLQRLQ